MTTDRTPGRWQEIERIYHDAHRCHADERAAFLDRECAADADLRREVESLLAYDTEADRYLERPAIDDAAGSLASDRGPLLAGRQVGGYEILSFLGAGGMGEVYRARDIRLDREVALKVLERSVALDASWIRRFEEEARAASALTHPNIVTIYGVGEDDDVAYIAMELVQGSTLREKLAAGGVAIDYAIDVATQLADAFAAAHGSGIVHRDLKPENVMVTPDGLVKVLDFGIAKRRQGPDLVAASNPGTDVEPVTEQGRILGTAGYMSPEQAAGLPADHRSDQFSFGAILYELVCGCRAFDRSTKAETLEAIRTAQPVSVEAISPGAPSVLRDIVARCLAKRPEDRYARTLDLALALRRLRDGSRRSPGEVVISRRGVLWLGSAAALSVAVGSTVWRFWPGERVSRSLAVLPFANLDGNPDVEYLCEGITESLIRRLANVPDLDVRSRSAAFNFNSATSDPIDVGRRLGVDAVLTGTMTLRAGNVETAVRLVDVGTGSVTWTERYERPGGQTLVLQHDLARAIVEQGIRRTLRAPDQRRFDQEMTLDEQAHDLFLRGIYAHRRGGERNYLVARDLLTRAVQRDPTFALAHVSLASTYTVMTIDGFERPSTAWPESNRSIRRALELDPELPEAHAEQSSSWFFFDHDWDAAEREWNRALEASHSPALPDLLSGAALKLWALGRQEDALALARKARALDPLTPRIAAQEGHLLLHAGRLDEAVRVYEDVLDRVPDDLDSCFGLAETRREQGFYDLAIEARRRGHEASAGGGESRSFAELLDGAHGEAGYRRIEQAAAQMEVDGLVATMVQGAYVSPLDLARSYAQLGDADRAFGALDVAFEENSPGLVFLKVDRAWAAVRSDDRFAAAVQAVGLP